MRYLTKEWYKDCQKTHCHAGLTVSASAKRRSESYYQALYQKQLAQRIREEQDVMSREQFAVQLSYELAMMREDLGEETFQKMKPQLMAEQQQRLDEYVPMVKSDDAVAEDFAEEQERSIQRLQEIIPPEILSEVADIRVMALGFVSRKVKELVTAYSKGYERKTNAVLEAYGKKQSEERRKFPAEMLDNYGFHDARITDAKWEDGDLTLTLEGSMNDVTSVIWHHARIEELERDLKGAWWLYEESYLTEHGYEFHVLLWDSNNELMYLTLLADGVTCVFPTENEEE